jgi:hypothetical protein
MSPAVTTYPATCIPISGTHRNPEDNASHPLPCQTSRVAPSAPHPMPFKNEVVSDEDIDRYNLPFPKGEGRWWTRDAERDYYLWGGLSGNPAYDEMKEGRFYLYINQTIYWAKILPGQWSENSKDAPYMIRWETIGRIEPPLTKTPSYHEFICVLKEALITYGYDGEDGDWARETKVSFGF